MMGLWDRVEKAVKSDLNNVARIISGVGNIASGVAGAAYTPFGFVKDMITAPMADDEYEGFWGTIGGSFQDRGASFLDNLFGPDEGFGAAIGLLPKDAVRDPANKLFEGLETTYREGIAEPLATVQYVSQETNLIEGGNLGNLFEKGTWQRGYRNAQTTSFGQNAAFQLMGVDLDDEADRAAAEKSAFFKPVSGSFDAALRIFGDPTIVAGKAVGAARKMTIVRTADGSRKILPTDIRAGADLDEIMGTDKVGRFNEALEGKTAAEIRDQFFPNDVKGAAIATALFEAGNAKTRESIIRLGLGDEAQLERLRAERADLAAQMERAAGEQSILRSLSDDNFDVVNSRTKPVVLDEADEEGLIAGPSRPTTLLDDEAGAAAAADEIPSELERVEAEINALHDASERNKRAESALGAIRTIPKYRVTDDMRVGITRSTFYQSSVFATPVRMVFNQKPPRLVDTNDPAGDVHVSGFLRKAGLDKDEQDVWRSQYMAVNSPEGRGAILLQMEDFAINKMAEQNGLTRAEVDQIMTEIARRRGSAQNVLKSRAYDGENRSRLRWKDDGTGEYHDYPLLVSDTANVIALAPIEDARKAMAKIGEHKRRFGPNSTIPTEMLENFNQYWKASVLLRVGWPIRVVMDEQMRIMAKLGVMAQLRNIKPGLENKFGNDQARRLAVATRGFDENGNRIDPKVAAEQAEKNAIGFGTVQVGDYEIENVFGRDARTPNAAYQLTASKPVFERQFTDPESEQLNRLRELTGNYASVDPIKNPRDYGDAWLNAVNEKLSRDPLARHFLKGGSHEDAVKWLRTPEGQAHVRRLPLRRRNLEAFAGAVQDQVESYTLGNPDIMKAALNRKATLDDLIKFAPDAAMRPVVHGEILDDALGKGIYARTMGPIVQKLYTALGSVPSDTLSRHPYAAHMYRAEATRLTELLDAQAKKAGRQLTADDLALVERQSRDYAIAEVRKLLYDLSEQSDMAHLLRFVSPFYSAWQETMTRWAGLAVENPEYAMRLKQVWESPERAGIVTDENGNPVGPSDDEGDEIVFPDGTRSTIGRERFITLPLPKRVLSAIGADGLRTQNEVKFNKKSFNMILQGNPGVGVPVQFPVNEIVKHRPEMAESMKFILPFGPSQTALRDMLIPATARRVTSRVAGEEDRVFRNAALRIFFDQETDFRLGKRKEPPTWDGAMKDAKAFYNIRAIASFISPAAPGFRSPYQPQIDAYRRLRAENIETADQRFLDMYGEEFFALTQSFTKSADGVAPTVEAFTARSKYKDLIEASPELGSLIIGEEGAGEYANAVYQSQLANKVAPGSTTNQRYALSFEEVRGGPNVRLGWMEYRKVADLIDAERIERGLPNLQVKAADDLQQLKKALVEDLARRYPEWYEAFGVVDRNAQAKRLVAMRAIADDPRMKDRPDMVGLREYFDVRGLLRAALAEREAAGGSGSLDASSNMDLVQIWETLKSEIVEKNLAFSATYYRYLERDDLSAA